MVPRYGCYLVNLVVSLSPLRMPVLSVAAKKRASRNTRITEDDDSGTASSQGSDYFEDRDDEVELSGSSEDEEGEGQGDDDKQAEVEVNFREPQAWIERLTLTATKPLPKDLNVDDDPKREEVFIQHALLTARRGIALLDSAKIAWRRPLDFYAEMYKSDVHMNKVQASIQRSKSAIEQRAARRASKDQKLFGKEVQAEAIRQKAKAKREALEKVTSWRRKRGRTDDEEDAEDAVEGKKQGRRGARPPSKTLRPGGKKRPGKSKRHGR